MDCNIIKTLKQQNLDNFTVVSTRNNINGAFTYTVTSTDVSKYKYLICYCGGANNDGTCSSSISTTGTISQMAAFSTNTSLISSNASSGYFAIFEKFSAGATISLRANF